MPKLFPLLRFSSFYPLLICLALSNPEVQAKSQQCEPTKLIKQTSTSSNAGIDYRILIVEIKGNKIISTEDIMRVVKTRSGDKLNRENIYADLKAINDLGFFEGIQALPTPRGTDIVLTIYVHEKDSLIAEYLDEMNLSYDQNKVAIRTSTGQPYFKVLSTSQLPQVFTVLKIAERYDGSPILNSNFSSVFTLPQEARWFHWGRSSTTPGSNWYLY